MTIWPNLKICFLHSCLTTLNIVEASSIHDTWFLFLILNFSASSNDCNDVSFNQCTTSFTCTLISSSTMCVIRSSIFSSIGLWHTCPRTCPKISQCAFSCKWFLFFSWHHISGHWYLYETPVTSFTSISATGKQCSPLSIHKFSANRSANKLHLAFHMDYHKYLWCLSPRVHLYYTKMKDLKYRPFQLTSIDNERNINCKLKGIIKHIITRYCLYIRNFVYVLGLPRERV